MRKQANSKAIKKHMRNGGTNSFQFHSSPRMVCLNHTGFLSCMHLLLLDF